MLNYYKIFGRASTSQEKLKADKIAILLTMGNVKEAIDYAERQKIDAVAFGKIAKQLPN